MCSKTILKIRQYLNLNLNQVLYNIKFKIIKSNQMLSSSLNPQKSFIIATDNKSDIPLQYRVACKQLGYVVSNLSQLSSGVKLAKIVNTALFCGENTVLNNQIIQGKEQRKGNSVINVNMILRQIKSSVSANSEQYIQGLTAFKLIDNLQEMLLFLKWILNNKKQAVNASSSKREDLNNFNSQENGQFQQSLKQNIFQYNAQNQNRIHKHIKHQKILIKHNGKNQRIALKTHQDLYENMDTGKPQHIQEDYEYHQYSPSPQKFSQERKTQKKNQNQNIFQNIYFCDRDISPGRLDIQQASDSLDNSQKVSKKGSYKMIKPKVKFNDKKNEGQQVFSTQNKSQDLDSPRRETNLNQKKYFIQNQQKRSLTNQKQQIQARKTMPRMMPQRPPIYRRLDKQHTKTQSNIKCEQKNVREFSYQKPFNTNEKKTKLTQQDSKVLNKLTQEQKDQIIQKMKEQHKIKKQATKANTKINNNNRDENKIQTKQNSKRNSRLEQEVLKLQQQIKSEKRSVNDLNRHRTKSQKINNSHKQSFEEDYLYQDEDEQNPVPQPSKKRSIPTKSNRKLFKIIIQQTTYQQRKSIVHWLISINILNNTAIDFYEKLHEICKNGIIFPQIINRYTGRSKQLHYLKQPQKNAQIHANYQRVFNYLKDNPLFQSQVLFVYEYFVPEVVQDAFWSLLKSLQVCFQRKNNKNSKVFNRDSSIQEKLNSKQKIQQNKHNRSQNIDKNKSLQQNTNPNKSVAGKDYKKPNYQKIKYLSAVKQSGTPQRRLKQTPQRKRQQVNQNKSKRKQSFQFIKQLPQKSRLKQEQLVQVQQPYQYSADKTNRGYRQLYQMKKNHFNTSLNNIIDTPQKKVENSASKSRLISANTIKKIQQRPPMPSVTLQMSLKAIKYIKQKAYPHIDGIQNLTFLQDPIRNGSLLNKILIEEFKINYKYCHKPKSIIDCRQNLQKSFFALKQNRVNLPMGFQYHSQQIMKGQISIFYGIVYYILTAKNIVNYSSIGNENELKNQSVIMVRQAQQANPLARVNQILFWIRELEQQHQQISCLHIRDVNTLVSAIIMNNLLYKILKILTPEKYTIKPTYQKPTTIVEQQSNIKKVLSFYAHHKILTNQHSWKYKSIVKKDKLAVMEVMNSLMEFYKNERNKTQKTNGLLNGKQQYVMSFMKFAKNIQKEQNNHERLETTMANNSFSNKQKQQQNSTNLQNTQKLGTQNIYKKSVQKCKETIQIPWMRQMGFTDDLSLNNGVILCKLMSKFTMQSINVNQNPNSKAQCLINIRKALKLIDKFKWDQQDIASADYETTMEIYKFMKDKYKHCYAMKNLN